ncbi:ATP-binding protein [Breznakiellaceae bacterium SP9]
MSGKVIGRVAALEKCPTTIDNFCFWTDKDTLLNPFDVVVVDHLNDSKTYGVVEEISHITDSDSFLANYISNDFGQLDAVMNTERIGMNYVAAKVVGNTKNIYIPVQNGAKVSLGLKDDIQKALGLNEIKNPVVCGYLEMYSGLDEDKVDLPVYVNSDFLIGPEGAHLNISGISGLATKTSYAMFLLNALQQQTLQQQSVAEDEKKKKKSVAYIFMNVKGRDLLSIDEPSDILDETDRAMYRSMGLSEVPFCNVKYFYPYGERGTVKSYVRPDILDRQLKSKQAKKFKFTFNDDNESLDLLFSNIEDPNQTIESIINYIISKQQPFDRVDSWQSMLTEVQEMGSKGSDKGNKEISVMSWRKFKRIVRKSVETEKMFNDSVEATKDEVRLEDEIRKLKANDVYVVDIAKQDENMQAFVFGSVSGCYKTQTW